ncbi:hypothetical protein ANN_09557 [Periplaneta americana]|uniref:DUF4817 domain-containing protein n=1 Tax=Periplaneta americana TaxID=6978 RepID=A0ABQ8TLP6_PERAM|nr:hypothetical protein ANN_09557 [Periplaneta americana]
MYETYVKTDSCRQVCRKFVEKFPDIRSPNTGTVRNFVIRLRETGSLKSKIRRPKRRVLRQAKLNIGASLERSPNKSLRRIAQEVAYQKLQPLRQCGERKLNLLYLREWQGNEKNMEDMVTVGEGNVGSRKRKRNETDRQRRKKGSGFPVSLLKKGCGHLQRPPVTTNASRPVSAPNIKDIHNLLARSELNFIEDPRLTFYKKLQSTPAARKDHDESRVL